VKSAIVKNFSDIAVIIDVTVDAASGSITPSIEGYDEASGKWITLLTGAAIAATGQVVLEVGPHMADSSNLKRQMALPHQVRFDMAVADTDSMTYSVGAWLSP